MGRRGDAVPQEASVVRENEAERGPLGIGFEKRDLAAVSSHAARALKGLDRDLQLSKEAPKNDAASVEGHGTAFPDSKSQARIDLLS